MMQSHIPSPPKPFAWSSSQKTLWFLMMGIGVLTFVISLKVDFQRAWVNFLVQYFFWMCLGFAGIFFSALQYLSGAYWSVTVRRVSEVFFGFIPYLIPLFIVLLFGLHHLFEWTHADVMQHDAILKQKAGYLNTPFFVVRHIALYAAILILGGWIYKNSVRQDQSGDVNLTRLNAKIAAPFLLLFGWLFTFASIDLIMSLLPHWFSTIFGIYCWAGLFYSGLAMLTLWTVFLKRKGYLTGFVNENHYHDLGKLMFAFLVFWGYIAFSQLILIWYANLPEETVFYLMRSGPWKPVSYAVVLVKFVIPFFVLIARPPKRKESVLIVMALWYLAAQWLDIYWLVYPNFFKAPVFGWMEIGLFIGFAGLFLWSVGNTLSKVSVVAIRDPQLESALNHHQ